MYHNMSDLFLQEWTRGIRTVRNVRMNMCPFIEDGLCVCLHSSYQRILQYLKNFRCISDNTAEGVAVSSTSYEDSQLRIIGTQKWL